MPGTSSKVYPHNHFPPIETWLIVVTSAWWVSYSQIERKEREHVIRGKKNYLPPAMLVLGYGILWTTEDEETMERHERTLITESTDENIDVAREDTGPTGIVEVEDEPSAAVEYANAEESSGSDGEASNTAEDNKAEEDKYNLDQYGSVSEDEVAIPEQEPSLHQPSTKRHLSAKQRRDLKKGKSIHPDDESDNSEVDDVASSITSMSLSKSKPPPKVRGKKAKLKKMKARYADQSDEERELARKLLGTKSSIPQPSQEVGASGSSGETGKELQSIKKAPPSQPPRPPKPVVDEPVEVCTSVMLLMI